MTARISPSRTPSGDAARARASRCGSGAGRVPRARRCPAGPPWRTPRFRSVCLESSPVRGNEDGADRSLGTRKDSDRGRRGSTRPGCAPSHSNGRIRAVPMSAQSSTAVSRRGRCGSRAAVRAWSRPPSGRRAGCCSISSKVAWSEISGGASWTTGSPRSSARQYRPFSYSALERKPYRTRSVSSSLKVSLVALSLTSSMP